ncbi:MAG TPA: hypothetical protein ENI55_00860 [Alphaproteobacteria bacterium]|nr:hypothetical protein [Alphaproteobacteria bacterium]
MDVMVHISSADGAAVAGPLMRALTRAGGAWGCFVTNDGVRLLDDDGIIEAMSGAARAVVCERSWEKTGRAVADCPIEKGSQTINSAMMAEARRLVSL